MWFTFAFAAALLFAIQELLMRLLAIKTGSPRLFAIVFNSWGAVFAILVFFTQGGSFDALTHLSLAQYALITGAIICYGLYERFQFFARKNLEASTLTIIFRFNTVIAFVGSILVLGESLSPQKFVGAILAIGATFILFYKNPKVTFSPSFWYAIACCFFLGFGHLLDKPASAPLSAAMYSFILWCAPLGIIAYPGFNKTELVSEFRLGGWRVALAAFLNVIAHIFYIQAFALTEASRVIPVVASEAVLVVLGGIILLKEQDHIPRKLTAAFLAFIGIMLLQR